MVSASSSEPPGSASRLTVRHLFVVIPIAALAWAVTTPFADNSFLWHVRAGTLQLDRGRVITVDPFSVEFIGRPWRTQSWLADLLYGTLERAFDGLSWVPYFMFFLVACTVILVLGVTFRRSGHLGVTAGASLLLCWQAIPFASARPAAFSYALLAAVAAALQSRRARWTLPGIIWMWAALHGSFVLGIGLVVLEGLRLRSRRHLELAGIGAVLATLTAHGLGVWQILISFMSNRAALDSIQEWQPPDYSHPLMLPYGILILAAVYAAARGRIERPALIVIVPFLFFGMLAVRNLYPAMIVVLPYVATGLAPATAEVRRRDPAGIVVGIGLGVLALAAIGLTRPVHLSESVFPSQDAMDAITPGPLFHGIASGGYLIYAEWPERQVLVDDRAELFGAEGFARYQDVADGKGWEALFGELGISQALLDPEWPLVNALAAAGWTELYRDDHFVVTAEKG